MGLAVGRLVGGCVGLIVLGSTVGGCLVGTQLGILVLSVLDPTQDTVKAVLSVSLKHEALLIVPNDKVAPWQLSWEYST